MTADALDALRRDVDAAVAAGEHASARALLGRLWAAKPGPSLANYVIRTFPTIAADVALTPLTVAVLRSFTLEPTVPVVRAAGLLSGLDLTVHLGNFNTYAQEILDPSSELHTVWQPGVVVLCVQTRDIAPELWDGFADLDPSDVEPVVSRVARELVDLMRAFRARSKAPLVVHGLEQPSAPSLGVLDARSALGQAGAIASVNAAVAEAASELPDVFVLDYDGLVGRVGRERWHDPLKWLTMRMPIRAEHHLDLANEWLRYFHPIAGRLAKVLVLDLDNTLWGGVVGEDGFDGIVVGAEHPGAHYRRLQRVALDLRARGVLLAVCSKNNPTDALDVLDRHPGMLLRSSHFAAVRINWQSKADNLREIASELNVGIDSLVFVDDNPAERQLVRSHLPAVTVIDLPDDPARYADLVRATPAFERLALTSEDRERSRFYAEQRERAAAELTAGSMEDFLRSLGTKVVIAKVDAVTLARAAQLTQKTNQFNVTTRRYTEAELGTMVADPTWTALVARASDRFGDHGIVGVVIAQREARTCAWKLDTLLLSCRVIGRGIETAMLSAVTVMAMASGASHLDGTFIPTKKNAPASGFFDGHGFTPSGGSDDGTRAWSLDLGAHAVRVPDWIDCTVEKGAP